MKPYLINYKEIVNNIKIYLILMSCYKNTHWNFDCRRENWSEISLKRKYYIKFGLKKEFVKCPYLCTALYFLKNRYIFLKGYLSIKTCERRLFWRNLRMCHFPFKIIETYWTTYWFPLYGCQQHLFVTKLLDKFSVSFWCNAIIHIKNYAWA